MNSRRTRTVAVLAFIGSILFIVGIYLLVRRTVFLVNATASNAPVVSVSHEYVPKGRGSVLAYVPTVEVRDTQGQALHLKVDAFDESPVYSIGQQMHVVCNAARGCIEDTFAARWGDGLLDLLISLVFFAPLVYYKFFAHSTGQTASLNLRPDA
ncbi:MAG: DUF3592 domain-containing protein [Pyrinomonadaceae bacterium]